jgi:hypothetical protein
MSPLPVLRSAARSGGTTMCQSTAQRVPVGAGVGELEGVAGLGVLDAGVVAVDAGGDGELGGALVGLDGDVAGAGDDREGVQVGGGEVEGFVAVGRAEPEVAGEQEHGKDGEDGEGGA